MNKLLSDAYATDQSAKDYQPLVLDHVGQVAALGHWIATNATSADLVKYNSATERWYAASMSAADKFQRATDWTSWSNTTEITGAGLVIGSALGDFDVKDDGTIIAIGNFTDTYVEYDGATWTRRATLGTAPSGVGIAHATNVRYVPGLGKWVVAFGIGLGGAPKVWYGTDRATWTGPIASPLPAGAEIRLGSDGDSTLVMMGRVSGSTNLYLSKSTDAGATWSALVTIDTGIADGFTLPLADPIWTGSVWLVVASTSPGAPASKVYKSTDGLTWTLAGSLTTKMIKAWAADGCAVLASTSAGGFLVNSDDGATWRKLDRLFANTAAVDYLHHNGIRFAASGGGGLMVNASGTGDGRGGGDVTRVRGSSPSPSPC